MSRLSLSLVAAIVLLPVSTFSQGRPAADGGPHTAATGTLTIWVRVVPSVSVVLDSQKGATLITTNAADSRDGIGKIVIDTQQSISSVTYIMPSATLTTDRIETLRPYYVHKGQRIEIGVLKTITVVVK